MKKISNAWVRIMQGVNLFLEWAMRIVLAFMTIVVFTQVLSRVFHFSMPQLEELARYSNIYLAFLAVAYGMGKDSLVKVDALQSALKGITRKVVQAIANIASLITCALYFYSGMKLVRLGIGQQSSSMGFDLAFVYVIIPIGFAVAILNKIAYEVATGGEEK